MGRYLAQESLIADLVLVSPALRTRETWEFVSGQLPVVPATTEPRIYEASASQLLGVVREQPGQVHTLMLVGHNPGMEDLAEMLVQHGTATARDNMGEKFPTGALAVIDLPVDDWSAVAPQSGRLDRFVMPRMLADIA